MPISGYLRTCLLNYKGVVNSCIFYGFEYLGYTVVIIVAIVWCK